MLTDSSSCHSHPNDTFKSDVISSAPDLLKEQTRNAAVNGLNSNSNTPIVNKLLNNANNGTFPELGVSPVSPGSGKKLKDLPHTTTLKGCVAYVDVWSSDATDNRSSVFRNFLKRMGATVAMKFTKEQPITHLVFKDGHKSSLQKAIKRNVKIVNCLWVDRCRVLQEWVDEIEFLFDPTNYKPPKRFREMQPLEPEEMLRRSAESLKRRKARYEKKNARIMFQSPLVTNCFSANTTPTDHTTPAKGDPATKKPSILAMDTPFPASSLARFFSPSIIYETPMTDSMMRKMQRYKEGKRVFSPPTSEDEDSEDDNHKTPSKPTANSDSITTPDVIGFSPVPETQHISRKSWRESGILPPKLDFLDDEVPETQQIEAPDTPEFHQKPLQTDGNGLNEIPETQQLNTSKAAELSQPIDTPLFSSTATENETATSNQTESSSTDVVDSMKELRLSVSAENSELENTSQDEKSVVSRGFNNTSPAKLTISRKRRRKLLQDDECIEPMSILLSPQDGGERTRVDETSMVLPTLGYSTVKNLTKSGRYFTQLQLPSSGSSDLVFSRQSREPSPCNSQSTDFGEEEEERLDDTDVFQVHPLTPLGLYDRVKMRRKRLSVLENEDFSCSYISSPPPNKRSKTSSMPPGSLKKNTPKVKRKKEKRARFNKNKKKSTQFFSQAANSIVTDLKKRRSTIDFTSPIKQVAVTRKSKNHHIVFTNFHSKERSQIYHDVRRFPRCDISSTVREETTHVVCGASRRTLNVLKALAYGSWLLSKEWVTDSLSAGLWLAEESYEIICNFPAAHQNRRRKSDDPTWKNELFHEFKGYMYIANEAKPAPNDMKSLITACGGTVVGNLRRAAICIGHPGKVIKDIPVVEESWLLDSICENEIKSVERYLIDFT